MDHVLIAVDGSDAARASLEVGVEIAEDSAAQLTIVHVVTNDRVREAETYWDEQDDRILRGAGDLAVQRGLEPTLLMCSGQPAEEIAKAAERLGADLVVVGSRGRGRVVGTLLGSVSQRVLETCTQPVLVVGGDGASAPA